MTWLKDPNQRRLCVQQSLPGVGIDGRPAPIDRRFFSWGEEGMLCNTIDRTGMTLNDDDGKVQRLISQLAADEFLLSYSYITSPDMDPRAIARGGYVTHKFRRPAVKLSMDGETIRVDRKKCANCYKEEEITRSFKSCSRCSKVYYCGRDCQVVDWKKTGHSSVCGKPHQLDGAKIKLVGLQQRPGWNGKLVKVLCPDKKQQHRYMVELLFIKDNKKVTSIHQDNLER